MDLCFSIILVFSTLLLFFSFILLFFPSFTSTSSVMPKTAGIGDHVFEFACSGTLLKSVFTVSHDWKTWDLMCCWLDKCMKMVGFWLLQWKGAVYEWTQVHEGLRIRSFIPLGRGLWDKVKRKQKLRRHWVFWVCISGHSLVRSTKVM